jgi:outer membrane protein assembly factor BamB
MWRGGRKHTGVSPYTTSHVNGTVLWKFETEKGMESSPAIAEDGTIYIGCHDNRLYAINPDGTKKWHYQVGDGPVYSESGTGEYSGTKGILSSPAIGDDGLIYFTSMSDKLIALYPNGTKKWDFDIDTSIDIWSSPLVDEDGTVYVGSHDDFDGTIYAIDINGNLLWKFETASDICSSPAMDNEVIYFGSGDHYLRAVYASTGELKWKYEFEDFADSSPAIGPDGTIYIGATKEGKLFAIDQNGNYKWHIKLGNSVDTWSSPAIFEEVVYIGSDNGYLYAVNAETGELKWKNLLAFSVGGSPAIGAEGTIYINCECEGDSVCDTFFAFNQQGEKLWSFNDSFAASSPAIGSDGTIYFGTWNGLYAISNYSTIEEEDDGIIPIEDTNVWEPVDYDNTPGYEIIIMLVTIALFLFLKKKNIQ